MGVAGSPINAVLNLSDMETSWLSAQPTLVTLGQFRDQAMNELGLIAGQEQC